jgi:hypothetical protein
MTPPAINLLTPGEPRLTSKVIQIESSQGGDLRAKVDDSPTGSDATKRKHPTFGAKKVEVFLVG